VHGRALTLGSGVLGRVRTFARTKDCGALRKHTLRVPPFEAREQPQTQGRLASQYLLDESRLKRRETTIDLYLSDVGGRTVEVECSLPDEGAGSQLWYLPLAFFTKKDVAPNLEVVDGFGRVVPVPTKHQNFALTKRAINELIRRENLVLGKAAGLRELIDEVIVKRPVPARTSRIVFERNAEPAAMRACPLLRLLEDNFVLWVPVEGPPGSEHHFRISRQEIHHPDQIIVRKARETTVSIPTALGFRLVRGYSANGWPTVRWRAATERLLKAFALRPMEARLRDREACRAASSHLRLHAPPGFEVRNVRLAEILPSGKGRGRLREIDPLEEDVAIQGWDQTMGHVHLSKPHNPPDVYCRMTLGIQGGTNTLWMLATVLTAALLWVVHHHSRYGPSALNQDQLHYAVAWMGERQSRKEIALSASNRQIVAAALLVGPAFASAWSLRAESGELLRSFLAGSRVLLLLSAALSVAAALALAGILPTHAGRYQAVEAYAAISYFVAAPMVASWVLSSRPTWDVFRKLLNTERRNLLAIAVLALQVAVFGMRSDLSGRISGLVVLVAALGLAAIAANSVAEPLHFGRGATVYRPLAGFGCLPFFGIAGSFLGFYADTVPFRDGRLGCLIIGIGIAVSAVFVAALNERS
jgi:hypothetical protein